MHLQFVVHNIKSKKYMLYNNCSLFVNTQYRIFYNTSISSNLLTNSALLDFNEDKFFKFFHCFYTYY